MSNEIQQGLQDDLTTIEPDLMNMTRLFSLPDSVWDAPEYHFAAAIEGGQYVIRFYGKTQAAQGMTDIPSDADARIQALHRRRALRRLCRQTLYDLLRKETGIHPPWGSMTGIRPTHLMYEALNEGMSMADAQEHLVHQFDVAPEKAVLLAELVSVQQQLPPPGDDWMDVYIGIPFCTTRCTYCSFSSGELGDGHLVAPYLTALFREMDACAQLLRDAGKKLRAVYVGGGTPTSLNEEQLPRLLEKMMQCFPCAMEYTVEAGRPDTLTLPKLEAIRRAGVQRISINPQTMNDKTLRVIGRAHTAQQVEEAYAMARTAKIHHINMDVIAGLPGENIDDFARTMDAALRLTPESLTVHTPRHQALQPPASGKRVPAGRRNRLPHGAAGAGNRASIGDEALLPLPPEVHGGQSGERRLRAAGSCLSIQCEYYGRNDAHPRPRCGRHFQTRLSGGRAHRPCAERIQHRAVHCPRGGNDWAQKSTFSAGNATLTAKSTFRRRQIPLLACNLAHLLIQ